VAPAWWATVRAAGEDRGHETGHVGGAGVEAARRHVTQMGLGGELIDQVALGHQR
jgi:hypothetical protein